MTKEKQIEELRDLIMIGSRLDINSATAFAETLYQRGWRKQGEGEWIKKHRHRGGFERVTGVDSMEETHTVTIDTRCEYDDLYCSLCGKQSADNFLTFCPNCGARMGGKQ